MLSASPSTLSSFYHMNFTFQGKKITLACSSEPANIFPVNLSMGIKSGK